MFRWFSLFISMFILFGCATTNVEGIRLSLNPKRYKKAEDFERCNSIVAELVNRNSTLEKSPEWLSRAYQGIMLRDLTKIPRAEYENYKRYAEESTIYIIVHPAYYVFFESGIIMSPKEGYPSENLVERFYKNPALIDYRLRILQEQERLLRDFLEVASTSRKLIIIVLPRDYKEHFTYGYKEGLDEYARYINELTNESESVLYVVSKSWDSGLLDDETLSKMVEFLRVINPRNIIFGGGYIGRCLQNSYYQLTQTLGPKGIYVAPEISAISPSDMDDRWTQGLLTGDGRINFWVAARNLQTPNAYGLLVTPPAVKGIVTYSFYPKKKK